MKTASAKGIFKMQDGKIYNADMPFEVSSLRGTEKERADVKTPAVMKVVESYDLASIYRIPLEDEKFLDVLFVFPDNYMLLGEGTVDRKLQDNEPFYLKNYELKPIEEYTIGEGISPDKIISDVQEILSDPEAVDELAEILEKEPEEVEKGLKENPLSVIKEVAQKTKPREFKSFFPEIYKEIKEGKGINISKIKESETLTPEKVKELAREKLSLNTLNVLAGEKDVLLMFAPERIPFISSLATAKMINNAENEFKLTNFLSQIYKPSDVEKVIKKIDELLEAEDISEESVKLAEKVKKELKDKGEVSYGTKLEAIQKKKDVIKEFLAKEGILKTKELLKKKKGGFFLANTMSNYGIPLTDFSQFDYLLVGKIPKPVQVEGKWHVVTGVKPFCGIKNVNGKIKVVPFNKIDNYTVAFDKPIFFVLREMMKKETTISQIRKLMGDGYGYVRGLQKLKEDFGKFKNASMVYGKLVEYIYNKLAEVAFKDNATAEDVKNVIAKDEFLQSYMDAMQEFLFDRAYRPYDLKRYVDNPKKFLQKLNELGILKRRKNRFLVDTAKLEKHKEEIMPFLKDPEKYKTVVTYARNLQNVVLLTKETKIPESLIEEAKRAARQLEKYINYEVDLTATKPKQEMSEQKPQSKPETKPEPEPQTELEKEPEPEKVTTTTQPQPEPEQPKQEETEETVEKVIEEEKEIEEPPTPSDIIDEVNEDLNSLINDYSLDGEELSQELESGKELTL